jgi:pantoate--beta-alanine ligase
VRTLARAAELRERLDAARCAGRRVGLVPTMGALHAGHGSLVRAAAADCDEVVVTVFVNPLQFGPGEDLDAYPRDPDGDAALCAAAGATVLFAPPVEEMYPDGRDRVLTSVTVESLAAGMEGSSRPTHFAGVCTVVAKLFNLAGPCRAYFGEKDFQQLAIVRRMARDLSFPVEVVGCPTVREPDGLAMSSRNRYLSDAERAAAPVLVRALWAGAGAFVAGTTDAATLRELMAEVVAAEPLARLDYVEVADAETLRPVKVATPSCRLFGAVQVGRARLIDNVAVDDTGPAGDPVDAADAVDPGGGAGGGRPDQ